MDDGAGPGKEISRSIYLQDGRPTIGMLGVGLDDVYSAEVWWGVADVARERGVNLIYFSSDLSGTDGGAGNLYSEIGESNIDGLMIMAGMFRHRMDEEQFQRLVDRYRPLPIVSISVPWQDTFSVETDDYVGMRSVVEHLIEAHGFRRIACIRGMVGQQEAEVRYRAYVEALAAYGIDLDDRLVVESTFLRESGGEAVYELLDRRRVAFEAIVAVNDNTALGALDALRERGVQTPDDVAVVGFDDMEIARVGALPLTTVRQPIYEKGRRAAEMLLDLIAGRPVQQRVVLPTQMVLRQSCGCMLSSVVRAGQSIAATGSVLAGEQAIAAQRADILAAMVSAVAVPQHTDGRWAEALLDGFIADLGDTTGQSRRFVNALSRVLDAITATPGTLVWQDVISALHARVVPLLGDVEMRARGEALCEQGRVVVGDVLWRAQVRQRAQEVQLTGTLRRISQRLMLSSSVAELTSVVTQYVPELGIEGGCVSLYERPEMSTGWVQLVVAFNEQGVLILPDEARRFPTRQLAPQGLFSPDRPHILVTMPLYFQQTRQGVIVLEVGPRQTVVYGALRLQLSTALHSVSLVQRAKRQAERLRISADVSAAASSVLDPDVLVQRVVDLARERFDLYYAGLFLVDLDGAWTGEPGRWAVLRSGTGAAGQKMIENGHKLEIGGDSMIGRCVDGGEADIQLDVGQTAVRFANPWLPDTRSEMALPLIARGEVIGALTIQSAQEAAFTPEDISVFQSMANQVSNAIINARLVEAMQVRVREMEVLEQVSRAVSGTFDLDYVLDVAVRVLTDDLRFTYMAINLIDEQARELRTSRGVGLAAGLAGMVRALDDVQDDILIDIARKGQIEVIDGWDDRFDRELWEREGHVDLVRAYVPLLARGAAIGVLEVGYRRQERLKMTEDEVRLLRGIADRLAVAVENARLFQETQAYATQQGIIADISAQMQQATDIESLLRVTAEGLNKALGTSRVYVRVGADMISDDA